MRFNDDMRLVAIIASELHGIDPRKVSDTVQLMSRTARSLHRLYEAECNRGLTPREEKRERTLTATVLRLAGELAPSVVSVDFNGDPRGYPVKLKLKCGKSNDFTGEVWGLGL